MSYAAVNMDALRKEAEALKSSGNNSGSFKDGGDIVNTPFKAGSNYMWVLPPWREGVLFSKLTSVHWNIPVGMDDTTNKVKMEVRSCGASNTPHGRCPICDIILNARGLCEKEFLDDFNRGDKYCINAIRLELDENGLLYPTRQRPYVYKLAPTIRKLIIQEMSKPNIMDVTDPFLGFPIEVIRPEKFIGTNNYTLNVFAGYPRGPIPTPKELEGNVDAQQKWIEGALNQIHDLDNIFRPIVNDKFKELIDTSQSLIDYLSEYQNVEIDRSILDDYKNGDFWKDNSVQTGPPKVETTKKVEETHKVESNSKVETGGSTVSDAQDIEKPVQSDLVKEAIKSEVWDKKQEAEVKKTESGVALVIGGKDYCITGIIGNILHLENEEEEERFACNICQDRVWKRDVFVEKHCMKEHGDEPITLVDRDAETSTTIQENIKESEPPITKEISNTKVLDHNFLKENEDGSLTYVDVSGISLKIKQKCFGNVGNDELCDPKLRKICIHKPKCQECIDRMAK